MDSVHSVSNQSDLIFSSSWSILHGWFGRDYEMWTQNFSIQGITQRNPRLLVCPYSFVRIGIKFHWDAEKRGPRGWVWCGWHGAMSALKVKPLMNQFVCRMSTAKPEAYWAMSPHTGAWHGEAGIRLDTFSTSWCLYKVFDAIFGPCTTLSCSRAARPESLLWYCTTNLDGRLSPPPSFYECRIKRYITIPCHTLTLSVSIRW